MRKGQYKSKYQVRHESPHTPPYKMAVELIASSKIYAESTDKEIVMARSLFVANNFLSCYQHDATTKGKEKFIYWCSVIEQIEILIELTPIN